MRKKSIFCLIILMSIFFATRPVFSFPASLGEQKTLRIPIGQKNTLHRFKIQSLIFVVQGLLNKKDFNVKYIFTNAEITLPDIYALIKDDRALLARVHDNLLLVYFDSNFKTVKIKQIENLFRSTKVLLEKKEVMDLSEKDEKAIEDKVGQMFTYAEKNNFPEYIIQQLKDLKAEAHRVLITAPDAYIYYGSYMPKLKALDKELKLLHYL